MQKVLKKVTCLEGAGATLSRQLKQAGIHLSWDGIRRRLAAQQRLIVILPTDDQQQELYGALGIKHDPLGKRKTLIEGKNGLFNRVLFIK